jgi:peptide/nickel transport system substrate-binding protein
MHMDVAPFDNKDVRLALKYAIDREALLHTILRSYGSIGNDHPISRSQRYFAPQLTQREYDPDKARFHLRRAGLRSFPIQLSSSDAAFPGAVDTAVLYKEYAAHGGIDIEIIREPADGYWKNVWLTKPFCLCSWNGQPTAGLMFATAYAQDAAWNDTHFSHERFNQLLKTAQAELDEQKRAEQYAEMQAILHDDGGVIIPLFAADVCAANKRLQFGKLASHRELDGGKCAERWWWGEESVSS